MVILLLITKTTPIDKDNILVNTNKISFITICLFKRQLYFDSEDI